MTTCLGKTVYSIYCACLSREFYQFVRVLLFLLDIEGGNVDLIVLIPDHWISIYVS